MIFVGLREEGARDGGRGAVEEGETIEVGEEGGCFRVGARDGNRLTWLVEVGEEGGCWLGWMVCRGECDEKSLDWVGSEKWERAVG